MTAPRLQPTPKRFGEAERRVIDAFVAWLNAEGWRTWTEVEFLDVLAERDGHWLKAEAKSHTGDSAGLDVDTAYGQLLRRMADEDGPNTRYAIVVPPQSLEKALRVPADVRARLRIDVYAVDPLSGAVTRHGTNGAELSAPVDG